MIFMRKRRTEERHDAVAHDLIDGSFVAMHSFHHVLDHRIKKFPRFLRIAVGEQLHRSFHVGEQYRDLLALAFERALGGEDLFGEMFRSVGLGGSKLRGCGCRCARARPHSLQNLFAGGFAARQEGHSNSSRAPHSPQNFTADGFSCWQRGHCISVLR